MVKVSVIVPVYNVENYIEKCLNSLVNQTLKDIEIIIVNDGSTDSSELIIKKFMEKYPEKIIWLYTGKKYESLTSKERSVVDKCDVVVDGAYVEALKDVSLAFRGSLNQRLIDAKKTLEQNEIVLYNN